MPPVARLFDIGVGRCKIHGNQQFTGIIITASPNVDSNERGNARIGDLVRSSCGHIGVIITGSPNVHDNERPVARLTDLFAGIYTGIIITGSPNVIVN